MSYWPAGCEDFDCDSDEFDDDPWEYGPATTTQSASVFQPTAPARPGIPAGAEDDDSDDEGIYFNSSTQSAAAARKPASTNFQSEAKLNSRPKWPSAGAGRGRGRGGFSTPNAAARKPAPANNRQQHKERLHTRTPASAMTMDELKVAVTNGDSSAVLKLLDQGVPVDGTFRSGWTSLMYAANGACSELVDLLVNRGANVNFQKDMYSVLMAACSASGDVEDSIVRCVQILLEHKARINVYDRYRMSPFMYAAKGGRVLVCQRLLEKGAEINRQDMRGWTAMSLAASQGHGRLVRVLLDHGADVKIYTNDGQSPSDIAYSSGNTTLADVLDAVLTGTHRKPDAPDTSSSNANSSFDKCDDLQLFLRGLDLAHLLPAFQSHKITFEDLLKLTENDLTQMGVTQIGVQTTILSAVRDVHKKEWDTGSLQKGNKDTLSSLEATTILANVAKHLSFVQSSAVYVSKHLANTQQSPGVVQDMSQADGLVKFSKEAAQIAVTLSEQLGRVQEQVQSLSLEASRNAPDLVTCPAPSPRKPAGLKQPALLFIGAVILAGGVLLVKKGYQ